MAPRWPSMGPRRPRNAQEGPPKKRENPFVFVSFRRQEAPQDGPKTVPRRPKTAQGAHGWPMTPLEAPGDPQMAPSCPSGAQDGPSMAPTWPLWGPRGEPKNDPKTDYTPLGWPWANPGAPGAPKVAPGWPQKAPRWTRGLAWAPKVAPRWPQDGPKTASRRPKTAQESPRRPKIVPRLLQDASRCP